MEFTIHYFYIDMHSRVSYTSPYKKEVFIKNNTCLEQEY
jgi:hypothetical protein